MPADIELLRKLYRDTNEVVNNLDLDSVPGGNWAGLRCIEATYVINERGKEYLQVYVEEAPPDAKELKNAIEQKLVKKGWTNTTVITEW